jgi:hypothetical protein
MVAAEFYIDLTFYRDTDFSTAAALTEHELINKLDLAIKIFEDLKFEGLVARAYKFKGILWNLIYV